MSLYDEKIQSFTARKVRELLAADADLADFFGPENIRFGQSRSFEGPIRPPLLAVWPTGSKDSRLIGGQINARLPLQITLFLPRPAAPTPSLTIPPAPTGTPTGAVGSGHVKGPVLYYVTAGNESGESLAGAPLLVNPNEQAVALTLPIVAGATWRRLWRTCQARIAARWCRTVLDNTTTAVVDDTQDSLLGDELAPLSVLVAGTRHELLLGPTLRDHIRKVLYQEAADTLQEQGREQMDPITLVDDVADQVDRERNLWVVTLHARYGTRLNPGTMRSDVDETPA